MGLNGAPEESPLPASTRDASPILCRQVNRPRSAEADRIPAISECEASVKSREAIKAERDRLIAKLKRSLGYPEHGIPSASVLADVQRRLHDPGNVGVPHAIFMDALDSDRLTLLLKAPQ